MKTSPWLLPLLLVGLLLAATSLSAQEASPLRQRTNFDAGWLFQQGDPAGIHSEGLRYDGIKEEVIASTHGFLAKESIPVSGAPSNVGEGVACTRADYGDSLWQKLNLPHDWAIDGPFDQKLPGETAKLPWQGVGWYRKHFSLPKDAPKEGRTLLDIDGAMAYAVVWCNGKFVGGWPYGYASFQVDLTPFLNPGGSENVLVVRVENPPLSSRWYPGAGIYRHVWLVETSPVHVAHWGTAVKTPEVSADAAAITIQTTVDNDCAVEADCNVQTAIFACDAEGRASGQALVTASAATLKLPASGRSTTGAKTSLTQPKLWDLQHPNLYAAVTTVSQNGKPVDRCETTFGVRTIQFTADNGFLLNGQRVPLQGVCDHHDLGALGAALNDSALRRQISRLKEMGCNAIRTSHNPPSPELLNFCDRLGMLVMDESFDCWKTGKNPNDYSKLWADWHEKDLRALVRRDRNHPSVILWSVGNEVPDQGKPEGPAIAAELTKIAHDEDGGPELSRRTTAACDHTESGFNDFHKGLDVMGFNYKPTQYARFRQANPQQPVIGTETSSCVSTRGFYTFPVTNDKRGGEADFQMSDYDLSAPSWANPPDLEFKGLDEAPFAGGEFVWTGFDYLGEPTPYGDDWHEKKPDAHTSPSRSSYFGIIDLAGFPKDRYYLYQARWRAGLPMAHLLPHWTWPDRVGQVTPVHVFTSGDEAELFLNGESLGRKKKGALEYRLRWDDVKYAPGELKVVAYKDGKEWATDTVKTAGEAAKIVVSSESTQVNTNGVDLAYVDATVIDKDGNPVPRSSNGVKFTVTGPAEIVATDNGDATAHAAFQAHDVKAFNGKCLVIVRPKARASEPITLRAESAGLQGGEVTITTR